MKNKADRRFSMNKGGIKVVVSAILGAQLIAPCSAASLTAMQQSFGWLPWLCNYQIHGKASDDILKLQDYEVIVIIDKSRSMLTEDCQPTRTASSNVPPISRWQWCHQQLMDVARQADGVLPNRFRVVTFAGDDNIYDNVDPPGIEMIFAENTPGGPTHATQVLRNQLNQYFAQRSEAGARAKPLLVAMITDGCPDNPRSLKWEIQEAANSVTYPGEVKISVLQVGHDGRAQKLLTDLNALSKQNAKYDIVATESFEDIQQGGLVHALANAVSPQTAQVPQRQTDIPLKISHN